MEDGLDIIPQVGTSARHALNSRRAIQPWSRKKGGTEPLHPSTPTQPLFDSIDSYQSTSILDAIVISDIHLGSDNCQAKLLIAFLEEILHGDIATRRLIINGDMFDSIDFRRLRKTHWKVLSMIRHLSDKMDVIWTCGNHDGPAEIISHLLGVEVRNEFIFTSGNKRLLVLHGDIFDDFIDHHPILTWIGDAIYNVLQKVDRRHYIARLAKARSKTFLHCIDKVQQKSMAYGQKQGCDAVLCGHTHQAVEVPREPVAYFNSGSWTEIPSTYLTVEQGHIKICLYVNDYTHDKPVLAVPVTSSLTTAATV